MQYTSHTFQFLIVSIYYFSIPLILFYQYMTAIINRLFQRVLHVKIQGQINQKMTNSIIKSLDSCNRYQVQAILVSINSNGGSLTQSKNIINTIRKFSLTKQSPVYCFAEDVCLNSANLILTSGTKCYSNKMSIIGDLGYSWSSFGLVNFSKKYQIKQQFIAIGQKKVKFNPFEDLTEDGKKWLQNFLYTKEHDLKVQIIKNRGQAFKYLKLTKEIVNDELLSKGIINVDDAVRLGYIDGIKNIDELISERYDDIKIQTVNKKSVLDNLKIAIVQDLFKRV